MPIYEYECGSCGGFEVMQKMSEEPLKTCEKCGGPVHRLVSLSSFALVGGGWYKDLYSSTKPGASTSSSPSPTSTSTPAASSESKPKAETKPSTTAAA